MKNIISLCLPILVIQMALAQDYRIAPKSVKPSAPEKDVAVAENKQVKAKDENEELISYVKGMVFVSDLKDIHKKGIKADGVVLKNIAVPDETKFKKVTKAFLHTRMTQGDLNILIEKVIVFYREHDRPVIDVVVPAQDITNGVIQLIILEGKVGKVVATGNRWFSSEEIQKDIRVKEGDVISSEKIQRDLDWANSNPFHQSQLVYTPGDKPGQTDLVLKTQDRFPARFYAGYEDSGNQATGYDRYEAGLNWGDAFHLGMGQQLNYQYTTSGNGTGLQGHSGSYMVPLPWHHDITVFGSYVDTKGEVPDGIELKGRSYQISGRYDIPLPTYRSKEVKVTESFSAGFDYKYNDNSLEFNAVNAGTTLYDVDQFFFSYRGLESDSWGQTSVNEQLFFSPGGFGGHNTDQYYEASRSLARSSYIYNNLVMERITRLPEDFSLVLRGTLQHSNQNLVPSEQLGFGGYSTIRGYDDREINSDEGYIFTTEVRTPSISFGEWAGAKNIWNDEMQFLGFWDYGSASNHHLVPAENPNVELSSVGAGFRYNVGAYASVRFDYGFQLLRTGFDQQHGSRANVGVTLSY